MAKTFIIMGKIASDKEFVLKDVIEYLTLTGELEQLKLKVVESFDIKNEDNVIINADINAYNEYVEKYSANDVVPIYIYAKDMGDRLEASIEYEMKKSISNYQLMCETFLIDEKKYADSVLNNIPNLYKVENNKDDATTKNVVDIIKRQLVPKN